jgi:hypothetical protein
MTDYAALPPSVLAKVATLEHHCLTLASKLDGSRRDLQSLSVQQRNLAPRTVHDEYEANRESERVIAEAQRLSDAVAAQTAICERLEKRLRAEERVIASCKQFLHELPDSARLRVVEGQAGDLDDIRQRIKEVNEEMTRVRALPIPSDDIAARVTRYVDALAASAQPVIQGIGDGQALRVLYPVNEHADRVTLSGFSETNGSALLLAALVDGERLAERLLRVAVDGSITANERSERLRPLQQQMTRLRYDEEATICVGDDVSRWSSAPAWAVLQVEIEHALEVAA